MSKSIQIMGRFQKVSVIMKLSTNIGIDIGSTFMEFNRLIPEGTGNNIEISNHFYMDLCGFQSDKGLT